MIVVASLAFLFYLRWQTSGYGRARIDQLSTEITMLKQNTECIIKSCLRSTTTKSRLRQKGNMIFSEQSFCHLCLMVALDCGAQMFANSNIRFDKHLSPIRNCCNDVLFRGWNCCAAIEDVSGSQKSQAKTDWLVRLINFPKPTVEQPCHIPSKMAVRLHYFKNSLRSFQYYTFTYYRHCDSRAGKSYSVINRHPKDAHGPNGSEKDPGFSRLNKWDGLTTGLTAVSNDGLMLVSLSS